MNQLAQLLILYLTTPQTDFYLSKIIKKSKDPTLEPYDITQLNVGSPSILGQPIDIAFKSVNIQGLSNIQIAKKDGKPDIQVAGDVVTFHAVRPNTEAPPAGVPTALTVNAQLELTANQQPSPLVPVVVTIDHGKLNGVFSATGDAAKADSVEITFTSASVTARESPDNIHFDLSHFESFLRPQVESYLKQKSTLKTLVDKMNAELAKPSVLASLSKSGTEAARGALKQMAPG